MRLRIEKAVYGGDGLGRDEGKAVFVPLTLPGETIEAQITRDKGSFAHAALVSVLEPAPGRVAPPCPYYGGCGGCQYQHATYPLQLTLKQQALQESLTRAGLGELPAIATHSALPWEYRNRIRLHVRPHDHALGYRQLSSHNILPVQECPIAAPLLQDALGTLQTLAAGHRAGDWCEEVTLFTDASSESLLLALTLRPGSTVPFPRLERLCRSLNEQFSSLRGAAVFPSKIRNTRERRSSAMSAEDAESTGDSAAGSLVAVWGEPELSYKVGHLDYRVNVGAFFQGNRFLVDTLRQLVLGKGPRVATAWDLYAGVGLFACAMAGQGTAVTAVEGAKISAADLRRNLGHGVRQTSTHAFLAGHTGPSPERIILDPPRNGLGIEASRLLAGIRSPSITYVSCDPATLARDLRVLVDAGYTISSLDLLDMFPQTFHLETVVHLQLR